MVLSRATISRPVKRLAQRLPWFLAVALMCVVGQSCAARAADPVALLGATPVETFALAGGGRLLVWRIEDRAGAARPLELVAAVVPGGAAGWRLLPVDASGPRAALLRSLDCPGAAVLTSGGFFAARDGGGYAPLGLAVGDGVALSPYAPRRWGGVLERRGDQSTIVPLANLDGAGFRDQALQSSPIIVAEGRNDMLRDDGQLDNRVAIGLDDAGGVVAVGAFRDGGGAVSLHTLAELILALGPVAGLEIRDALALDGGSSAELLVPDRGLAWGSQLPGYMPNALCLVAGTS
jgi:hypothetical protein